LQEDKIAVLVATVTDDARMFEVPKLRVCALRFTETARARIVKVSICSAGAAGGWAGCRAGSRCLLLRAGATAAAAAARRRLKAQLSILEPCQQQRGHRTLDQQHGSCGWSSAGFQRQQ
jgi:hypothetical protein